MPLFHWSKRYSLGIEVVDEQHKVLVGIINELHDALKEGEGEKVLGRILRSMEDYAKFHFSTEEKYMAEFGFDGYAPHKAEHDIFRKKIPEFKESFDNGNIMIALELMRFLTDWLRKHIDVVDRQFVKAFREQGL